jgi:hypothetical protein
VRRTHAGIRRAIGTAPSRPGRRPGRHVAAGPNRPGGTLTAHRHPLRLEPGNLSGAVAPGLLESARIAASPEDGSEAVEGGRSLLSVLKADPGPVGLESVLAEVDKLRHLRALDVPGDVIAGVDQGIVQLYRQRAAVEPPSELRAHPAPIRATLLAALAYQRSREVTDGLVDLLIQVIRNIGVRAEKRVEKELLNDLRRVTGKAGLLFRIAEASVERPDGRVRDVVFPAAGGEQTLHDLVREFRSSGPAYRFQVHTHLRASYASHYRRMVPQLLEALEFRSNNAVHRPLIEALELLKRYASSSQRLYPAEEDVPLDGVVRPSIQELVVTADAKGRERVDRINYEICVLQALREQLRCKEIWVVGADRYRNPDEDLPQDFAERRETYYAELQQPLDADLFIGAVRRELDEALRMFHNGLPRNPWVKVLPRGKFVVSPLPAQPEPVRLGTLKNELGQRWPMTSLLDMLKETDLRVGITPHFVSTGAREHLDRAILQNDYCCACMGWGPTPASNASSMPSRPRAWPISAIFGGATSARRRCGRPSPRSPTPFSACATPRSGVKRRPRVPPTRRNSAPGIRTFLCTMQVPSVSLHVEASREPKRDERSAGSVRACRVGK